MLHIRPWEIDLLTYEQFERACMAIDEYNKSIPTTTHPEEGEA